MATKCECGQELPMHLVDIETISHLCSCNALYRSDGAQYIRVGNERNPVAEYDAEQQRKRAAEPRKRTS